MKRDLGHQTINDFGSQWHRYPENSGHYASVELLRDIFGPLLAVQELAGKTILEVGSGSGRVVGMLLEAGAAKVIAVEPSSAMSVLRRNTEQAARRVEYLQVPGDQIPDRKVDFALAVGVLHHIPDPDAVVRRVYEILQPGGSFLFWVYGREGNGLYLALVRPLRWLTLLLPDAAVATLSQALNCLLTPYIWLCRHLPLPLHRYLARVLGRFTWRQRTMVIFDQLNPHWARYYREQEARELMERGGFSAVRVHQRHGYSWSVLGTRPASEPANERA